MHSPTFPSTESQTKSCINSPTPHKRINFQSFIDHIDKYNFCLKNNELMTPRLLIEDPKALNNLDHVIIKSESKLGVHNIGLNHLDKYLVDSPKFSGTGGNSHSKESRSQQALNTSIVCKN